MPPLLKRNAEILSAPVEDRLLMMSVSLGRYFSLNPVATRIWELLEQPSDEDSIVRTLLTEYDVDEASCREQVRNFLNELRNRGLVLEDPCG